MENPAKIDNCSHVFPFKAPFKVRGFPHEAPLPQVLHPSIAMESSLATWLGIYPMINRVIVNH
jgi:hypothetical protein